MLGMWLEKKPQQNKQEKPPKYKTYFNSQDIYLISNNLAASRVTFLMPQYLKCFCSTLGRQYNEKIMMNQTTLIPNSRLYLSQLALIWPVTL